MASYPRLITTTQSPLQNDKALGVRRTTIIAEAILGLAPQICRFWIFLAKGLGMSYVPSRVVTCAALYQRNARIREPRCYTLKEQWSEFVHRFPDHVGWQINACALSTDLL